mgnify:CR=1 FL=1
MENSILNQIPFDPAYIIAGLLILVVLLLILTITTMTKVRRLDRQYDYFMRGKDAETLEDVILDQIEEIRDLRAEDRSNKDSIRTLNRNQRASFQKYGLVKYNAFKGMGGNLSFVLTLLDANDNGFVLNVMHSREGCYNYIKEIVKGESYVELSSEETESLEKAIFQEAICSVVV